MLPTMYIVRYQDAEDTMSLARLAKEDFPITPGFVITRNAQKDFFAENDLTTKIHHLLGSVDKSDKKSLQKTSATIQKLILNGNLSQEFVGEVFRAYANISSMLHDITVILQPTKARLTEPITTHGEANILLHIKSIWASFFSPESILSLNKTLPTTDILVKKYSKNPISAKVYTTGEDKTTIHIDITKQKRTTSYDIPKTITDDYTFPNKSLIPMSQLQYLLDISKQIEHLLYFPQKITMCIERNTLVILDVQPLTPSPKKANETAPSNEAPAMPLQTATKIYTTLPQPQLADTIAKCQVDGIGLLEGNSLIKEIGIHPKKVIHDRQQKKYAKQLAETISTICTPFSPRPVIYQLSSLTTTDYHNLQEGSAYEPKESNPLLGFRGALRYTSEPEVLQLELDAIKIVRNEFGLRNLWIMLPFVRTINELTKTKKLLIKSGLYRSQSLRLLLSIDTPAQAILIDKFITSGIDGISVNLDSLKTLALGIDKDNLDIAPAYITEDDSLVWSLERLIHTAHTYSLPTSVYGSILTSPQLLEKLVELGVTSVIITPEALESTREYISEVEKKLWQK